MIPPSSAEASSYVVLDYLYCDASNYKAFGSIWLTGVLTDAERAELIECLDSGSFFVAEQIDVPPLYSDLFEGCGGPNEDDHSWHTFEGFREEAELGEKAEIKCESSKMLAAFRAAKLKWRPELSPNYYR